MQARARNAPVERQPERAVQEVQAHRGGAVAQEPSPQGPGQKGSARRTWLTSRPGRLAAGSVRGGHVYALKRTPIP